MSERWTPQIIRIINGYVIYLKYSNGVLIGPLSNMVFPTRDEALEYLDDYWNKQEVN